MTDRVYPSNKPNGTATAAAATTTNGTINPPPAKAHLYNPTRHPYRPQPNHRRRRSRRSCLCLCCFWSTAVLIILLLLATIAASAIYVLYQPQRPKFTVSALRIARFNLSAASDDTTHLTSLLNLTISAKNPNKKLAFFYDPITIVTSTSNQVTIANGSFPKFTSNPKNTTLIRSTLSSSSQISDTESVNSLRSDLTKKTGLPLKIVMDTKVVVKMDSLKSKKVGIRVSCGEIHGLPPKGKSPSVASTSDAKCKVDLRIKIWKWTF